ncbi:MAG: hypothetical protein KAI55_03730, partial [Candidatus Aenigmarchaeota archaeon]|nr:hypothetical protein [Candidatus Aenigmarchaeota archaeon]
MEMMKNRIIIGILIICLLMISGCTVQNPPINEKQSIDEPIDESLSLSTTWMACEKDSDCIETQPDCCGCSGGGMQIAINKE